ncbi:MAG: hypothetical protein ACRDI2_20785, partial [Chloroflexota bacterium]
QADLAAYYPPVMGYALLTIAPVTAGMIVGFLLLDQRDDDTLTALQVTPLPLSGYLTYRLAAPTMLSLAMTAAMLPLAGLTGVGAVPVLLASLTAAPLAPLYALALGGFAENKVQGFALVKAASVVFMAPLLAYFAPPDWHLAFGIVPTYWPGKLYWLAQAGDPGYWLYLPAGLAYQLLLLAALLRRFNQVLHR